MIATAGAVLQSAVVQHLRAHFDSVYAIYGREVHADEIVVVRIPVEAAGDMPTRRSARLTLAVSAIGRDPQALEVAAAKIYDALDKRGVNDAREDKISLTTVSAPGLETDLWELLSIDAERALRVDRIEGIEFFERGWQFDCWMRQGRTYEELDNG